MNATVKNKRNWATVTATIIVAVLVGCNGRTISKPAVKADAKTESEEMDEGGSSLYELRFGNWTEDDWRDNDYIRTLRAYIDNSFFSCTAETDEAAKAYWKKMVDSKFVIYNLEPYLLGGLYIQVVFVEMPERVFNAWVYSSVDEEKRKVIGYEVRSLDESEEESGLTKEEIIETMKAHPEEKYW